MSTYAMTMAAQRLRKSCCSRLPAHTVWHNSCGRPECELSLPATRNDYTPRPSSPTFMAWNECSGHNTRIQEVSPDWRAAAFNVQLADNPLEAGDSHH